MNIPYRMSLLPAFVCLKSSLFEFVNETLYFITVLVLQKNYKDRWEERDKEKEKEREREMVRGCHSSCPSNSPENTLQTEYTEMITRRKKVDLKEA